MFPGLHGSRMFQSSKSRTESQVYSHVIRTFEVLLTTVENNCWLQLSSSQVMHFIIQLLSNPLSSYVQTISNIH
jgi:hypothetical protein